MHPIVCIPLLLSWSFNFTNFTDHIIKCPPLPIHYSHTCHIGKKREGRGGGRHLPSAPDIERTKHPWQISAVCVITERNRRMTGMGEMRVRCEEPSAGAVGISAARRFGGASASGVDPASRSSPALRKVMVDSLTLLHAVMIHWQTWEKVALRMRPVFVKVSCRSSSKPPTELGVPP